MNPLRAMHSAGTIDPARTMDPARAIEPGRVCGAGQAQTEYLIVLALTVIVLALSSTAPSPVKALIDGVKSAFAAFAYAISFSV